MTFLSPLHDHPFAPDGGILLDAGAISAIRAALTGITIDGTTTTSLSWNDWVKTCFAAVHGPHLVRVHQAFREHGPREALALEPGYAHVWKPDENDAAASISAGANVLDALPGARHAKPLHALRTAVSEGRSPGYFATLLGCHAAFFDVAPAQAAAALAFLEWRGSAAFAAIGQTVPVETAFARAAIDASLGDAIAAAVRSGRTSTDDDGTFAAACA